MFLRTTGFRGIRRGGRGNCDGGFRRPLLLPDQVTIVGVFSFSRKDNITGLCTQPLFQRVDLPQVLKWVRSFKVGSLAPLTGTHEGDRAVGPGLLVTSALLFCLYSRTPWKVKSQKFALAAFWDTRLANGAPGQRVCLYSSVTVPTPKGGAAPCRKPFPPAFESCCENPPIASSPRSCPMARRRSPRCG